MSRFTLDREEPYFFSINETGVAFPVSSC